MKVKFNLTLNKEDKEEIKRQANEMGLSVSAYITVLIRDIKKRADR